MSRLDIEGLDGVLGDGSGEARPIEPSAVASSHLGVAQVELVGEIEDEIPFGFETAEPAKLVTPVYEDEPEVPTDPQINPSGPRITTTPLPDLEMDLPDPIDLENEGPNVARRVFLLAIVTVLLAGLGTWAFQAISGFAVPEVAEATPPAFPLGASPPGLAQPATEAALPEFDPGADETVAALMISPEALALQAELEAAAALRAAEALAITQAAEAEEAVRILEEQEATARAAAELAAEEARLEALQVAAIAAQDVAQAESLAEDQAAAALAARIAATEAAAAARRQRASQRQQEAAGIASPPAPTVPEEAPVSTVAPVTSRTTNSPPPPTGENMSAGRSPDTYGLRTPVSAIPDTLPAPSTVLPAGPNNYSALFPAAFSYNNNAMRVTNEAQAMAIINAIIATPGRIRIVGHTDSSGSAAMNLRLGWLRANTVRKFLIRSGVEDSRITVESAGSSQPITTNETREGREINRRVMLIYPRAQR
jgi:outer membrane protein OmpA-like peptidoglycan-associated protein